ncbi:mas-related G-protein coupled receptor member A-like [Perognathus longimembris pacificus]|uniref:mas-related G-protein coupled receptor member A-like n=1 Tax=Perognathus longimembris pacificus TaxID=214514 RepID=UPI0020186A5F|nr:mas-related G-protein coupled receptor member A-like [Perognathus longimembris pacificus]
MEADMDVRIEQMPRIILVKDHDSYALVSDLLAVQNKELDAVIAQPEIGSTAPLQVTSAALNRKKEERDSSGEGLSMEPTTPTLIPEITETSNDNHKETCSMEMTMLRCLEVIIDVVGLVGNATVIWLLCFCIHRNAISVYILNLAVADFLYICFQFIYTLDEFTSYLFDMRVSLQHVIQFCFLYSYTTGLSFLSVISLERCLSVLCPIWYRYRRPRHASSFLCVLVWALSGLFPVLVTYCCQDYYGDSYCLLSGHFTAGYLLFLFVVLSGSSLALAARMFCGSGRMSLTRLYVTVLLTVLVFIFCGLPYGIYFFLIYEISIDVHNFVCYFQRLLNLLSSVNSCANPIIYFFVGSLRQRHRQKLKRVMRRALQDTPEDNECIGSLSQGTLEMSASRVEH